MLYQLSYPGALVTTTRWYVPFAGPSFCGCWTGTPSRTSHRTREVTLPPRRSGLYHGLSQGFRAAFWMIVLPIVDHRRLVWLRAEFASRFAHGLAPTRRSAPSGGVGPPTRPGRTWRAGCDSWPTAPTASHLFCKRQSNHRIGAGRDTGVLCE